MTEDELDPGGHRPEIARLLAILDKGDPPAVLDNIEALAACIRRLHQERDGAIVSLWAESENSTRVVATCERLKAELRELRGDA